MLIHQPKSKRVGWGLFIKNNNIIVIMNNNGLIKFRSTRFKLFQVYVNVSKIKLNALVMILYNIFIDLRYLLQNVSHKPTFQPSVTDRSITDRDTITFNDRILAVDLNICKLGTPGIRCEALLKSLKFIDPDDLNFIDLV